MTAVVTAATVVSTGVAFAMMMVMVVAADIGIIDQLTLYQRFRSRVRAAADTAEKLNTGCIQRHPGAAAYAAADQNIHSQRLQNTGQGSVTASIGIHHLGRNDLALLNLVNLKLLSVAKMLEDLAVFISDCNSHNAYSFF